MSEPPSDSGASYVTTNSEFTLTLDHGGVMDTTAVIAWDAEENAEDETLSNIESTLPATGGSLQSRLQELDNLQDVWISRQTGASGGYTWTITFRDAGDIGTLTVGSNNVDTDMTAGVDITLFNAVQGATFPVCTGNQLITGLVQGEEYFVRVMAYNQIG